MSVARLKTLARSSAGLALATSLLALPTSLSVGQAADDTTTCTLEAGPKAAVVGVVDAETIALDDDSQVRLIGALAPRNPFSSARNAPWQPERQALAALDGLVLGQRVELAFSGRRKDRYGRLLAHVFVERDGQRAWVQGELLAAGHARAYALPGSTTCIAELIAHERIAREKRNGLWRNGAYRVRPADDVKGLLRLRNSYQIVEGEVAAAAEVKGRIYLNFGKDWRSDFTAALSTKAVTGSGRDSTTLTGLAGKRVRVRGWIERRNGPYIAMADAAELEVLDEPGPRPGAPVGAGMPETAGSRPEDRGDRPSLGRSPPGNDERPAQRAPGANDF